MINETAEMAKIISTMGVTNTALAIIFVVFLVVITYILHQNKQLVKSIMTDLKDAINELSDKIQDNTEANNKAMIDIVVEVESLKTKYDSITAQLVETMLDDKKISKRVFHDIAVTSIKLFFKSVLTSAIDLFDKNGLDDIDNIKILKDKLDADFTKYKEEICNIIDDIEIKKEIRDKFIYMFNEECFKIGIRIEKEIYPIITVDLPLEDHNYYKTKQMLKNILSDGQSDIFKKLKEILR